MHCKPNTSRVLREGYMSEIIDSMHCSGTPYWIFLIVKVCFSVQGNAKDIRPLKWWRDQTRIENPLSIFHLLCYQNKKNPGILPCKKKRKYLTLICGTTQRTMYQLAPLNTKCAKSGRPKIGKPCERPLLSLPFKWRALYLRYVSGVTVAKLLRAGAGIADLLPTIASIAAIDCTRQSTIFTSQKLERYVSPLLISISNIS